MKLDNYDKIVNESEKSLSKVLFNIWIYKFFKKNNKKNS
jgi:hypothetical protein